MAFSAPTWASAEQARNEDGDCESGGRQQDQLVRAGEWGPMSVEALPEETFLSPFLQKLSRSAPVLFSG
jgi:hypothetical protein